ncbi:MBL fold metallo-hydrolase [Chromobacterium amazonense]|uniref:MBL fold metallo-hydrolase n=1 Tax=Chromobacterium amazonense TaxID=1382803 RepID=A0ABU8V1N1_9NEIS|nr:MBL fold metallo-hydrolase [Chromobacterium amazonense]MBM2886685.1 FprA family A-type flavoprotein [Chromobacterium amazonense]MDE1712251.1 MBL fold metallo-hydrolase [Chromobacterium amazonense]MDQ4541852.1 MBL fold metallo-hydrolase [Chromobacterium amazonense]
MAQVLYDDGNHKCVAFTELVQGDGIQANQFAIIDQGEGILLDPGGNLTYKHLLAEMAEYFLPSHTRYIFASHQDPDIVASANGWLLITDAKIIIAEEWVRFLPHFCVRGVTEGRLIPIPPQGMLLNLGGCELRIVPAHYLHTVGFFQIYDPLSKILFSGDIGASLMDGREAGLPVRDFERHLRESHMEGFHRRYMSNNKACRLWVEMVRQLDIEWLVPQHGGSYQGKDMVKRFLDWFERLECGTDLLSSDDYALRQKHEPLP